LLNSEDCLGLWRSNFISCWFSYFDYFNLILMTMMIIIVIKIIATAIIIIIIIMKFRMAFANSIEFFLHDWMIVRHSLILNLRLIIILKAATTDETSFSYYEPESFLQNTIFNQLIFMYLHFFLKTIDSRGIFLKNK
jgi:hypothetical protein